ncbi:MAG: formate--tetrahydrofolate ligase [Clostridia bacterium]|nr:formate--tetrahydrofolate ligase [Clostridia bacterium]
MEDIEIAKRADIKNIMEIANKVGINEKYIEQYGKYKAKIDLKINDELKDKGNGKLILVTAINPTPLGEGKTTVSIGIADALNKIGKKAVGVLREPSLGPVFGIKGGATGGGYAQVIPMEDINLHFTGDIHAITAANNLLSAMIDNHIYSGNELKLKEVTWRRCMDLNDRQLRKINTGLSGEKNTKERIDGFDISVASEIMAIVCLSKDLEDLKKRISRIIIGYNEDGEKVTAKDIKAEGAMTVLLKDAIKPNLVQTLENNPVLMHGGPFANIAHGCNSIIATKLGLKLGDYVVTEAGFGADLGAEKFLDIKTRALGVVPNVIVCVATIKALKYHGGMDIKDISNEGVEYLKRGVHNLLKHIDNIKNVYGINAVVAINRFNIDTENEINTLKQILSENNIEMSLTECWGKGSEGAIDLANKIVKLADNEGKINYPYDINDSLKTKIEKIATKIYGATGVQYTDEADEKIKKFENLGYKEVPVCISKTQYSLSDDPKNLLCEEPFNITVRDVQIKSGAGFLVALTGNVITMPGLPKVPAAEKIDIDNNGDIVGLF